MGQVILKRSFLFLMVATLLLSGMPMNAWQQSIWDGNIESMVAQASTTPTINIGTYIQFGKYYGEPILWRVIHKDANGDPVLLADRILTLKSFDAAGSYHPVGDRRNYGSNYYPDSNIRQWLNSNSPNSGANTIDWIQNDPSAANMWGGHNPYNTEKGFLADGNFSSSDRTLIKPLTHKVLLAGVDAGKKDGGTANHMYNIYTASVVQNYDTTAYYKNVTDSVFLLSVKQLKEWVNDNSATLGADYHLAKPTAAAVMNSTYKNVNNIDSNKNLEYWLNSPRASNSIPVRLVYTDNRVSATHAFYNHYGVRPALQLNLSSVIFTSGGTGTSENPYVVFGSENSVPDSQAPTAPSGLASSNLAPTTVTITWTASTDNVGVTAYDVYRGATLVGTVTASNGNAPATTYNVSGLTANTTYSFTVKAKDAAGNVSAASTALSMTTPAPDSQPPIAPTELNATNVTAISLTLNWTASTDNVGVTGYEVYQGTTVIATVTAVDGTVPTTHNVTELTANTTYSFTVKAKDAADNVSAASTALTVTTGTNTSEPTGAAPTDVSLSGNKVVEFNWVGYEIGSFSATDADAGDTFTYSLVNGEGSEDNADFTIDGSKLKTASVFEYQEDERFYIRVQVTDSTGNTFAKPFEVEVTQGNVRLNPANKIATIYFDRKLFDNSATATPVKTLKDFVKISRDADDENPTYEALTAGDTVKISGSSLIVTFENQITTEFNRIKIEAEAMKDLLGYKAAELLTTPLVIDSTGPTLSKVLLSRNKKSIELVLNEKGLMTSTAANLKAALTIDRGGTGVFKPLGSKDKVVIINEYKIGKDIIYKLNRRVVQVTLASRLTTLDNRIRINAGALKDFAGNNSLEIITPDIEDITGPELRAVKLSANNKAIIVQFNEEAAFGSGTTNAQRLSNLKSKIQLSKDGTTFSSLGETDTVALTAGNLVVTLATALTGANNKLQIGSGAVKDMFDNFNSLLTTANIAADSTPPSCEEVADTFCDSVTLPQINENKRLIITFNERVFSTSTLKSLVQIKVGSEPYKALGSKVSVSTTYETIVINFTSRLLKNTQYRIKVGAGAVKDMTGNLSQALETVAFEVDTGGPKLR